MPLFGSPYICGIYYNAPGVAPRQYLPRVKLESHTTLTPVCFATKLTQTYHNPSSETLSEARYSFPLYDGVSVGKYTISFADTQLIGVVQQKDEARATYQDAVDRGESAGLLENLPSGIFGVTLGNIPSGVDIFVDIEYCGELRHDAGIDGLRYTLPTSIAPRYGNIPHGIRPSNTTADNGIKITIDADMGASAIRKVQSPSHPISVSMGATSSQPQHAAFNASKASATLSLGSTGLAQDFVLQLVVDDISQPQATLETHPAFPNQRAIVASLVPKFSLSPAHPEIVFVADQSGSMQGPKNNALVSALRIFLKSLPLGVRFNIVAFGSHFKSLWSASQAYNEANLKQALAFIDTFQAHYGGTELLEPIKAVFENHLKGLPLEVMLLTDGEIWGEDQLFSFVNSQIRGTKDSAPVDARVFALGIGRDVSHTLVEGAARAGNGFAQFVADGEDADAKVMRMLKGALYAHTKDYAVEVNYTGSNETGADHEDDFELVERVNDSLSINEQSTTASEKSSAVATKSFFDESADLDNPSNETQDRYSHLPIIDIPRSLQAPANLPPLYPYNRTTAYFLLAPTSPQRPVSSITIRAKSAEGPLELTVPVRDIGKGTTVHQLAARRAIQDLEEGRGWLQNARIGSTSLKEKHESRFDELVEREAVRLGVQFQVSSKWASFVAIEKGKNGERITTGEDKRYPTHKSMGIASARSAFVLPRSSRPSVFASAMPPAPAPMQPLRKGGFGGGLFGSSTRSSSGGSAGLFGSAAPVTPPPPGGGNFSFGAPPTQAVAPSAGLFGDAPRNAGSSAWTSSNLQQQSTSLFGGPPRSENHLAQVSYAGPSSNAIPNPYAEDGQSKDGSGNGAAPGKHDINRLIDLQTFTGAWELNDTIKKLLQLSDKKILIYKSFLAKSWPELDGAEAASNAITATVLALAWLEKQFPEKKEVWDMVAGKGRNWVNGALNNDGVEEALAEGLRIM